ncbi:hypothetical protein MP638_005794 [Amoeboaphelidium occidentale]|nr:hypothetical protein MP638_005794 [Amoeboaphelidium occidentale]
MALKIKETFTTPNVCYEEKNSSLEGQLYGPNGNVLIEAEGGDVLLAIANEVTDSIQAKQEQSLERVKSRIEWQKSRESKIKERKGLKAKKINEVKEQLMEVKKRIKQKKRKGEPSKESEERSGFKKQKKSVKFSEA